MPEVAGVLVNPWAVPPPLLLLLMGLRPTHYPSLPSSPSDQTPSHRPDAFNEKFAFDLDTIRPRIEDKLEVLFPRHLCKASLVTFIGLTAAGAQDHQSIQTAPALVILPFIATVTSEVLWLPL